MDQPLRHLISLIDRDTFNGSTPCYPFDGLFVRMPPDLLGGLLMHDAASPRVPRRLVWEVAMVSALQMSGRRDETYLARAEALPSLADGSYIIQRVIAHALRGRARMELAPQSSGPSAVTRVKGAREDLDFVVGLIEQHRLPRPSLFATLVSAGNAWRTDPMPSAEEAIARYERAQRIGSEEPYERARLAKCHADGLIARGEPADFDRAVPLLKESLKVRKGSHLESETLRSLARAERGRRGDRTAADCESVHRILLEAERKDVLGNAEGFASDRADLLAAWLRHDPAAAYPKRALDEIGERWPSLRHRVAFARVGGAAVDKEHLATASVNLLNHPAMCACLDAMMRLGEQPPPSRTLPWMSSARAAAMEEFLQEYSRANDPDRLLAMAAELRDAPADEATPGRLVGLTRTLARLALFGCATREEVALAAREAEEALEGLKLNPLRAFLLLQLGGAWGPVDLAHPLRDFAEAARLYARAVAAAEEDHLLHLDACLFLARATQHRTDGNLSEHRAYAEKLYEDILRRAPALGADVTMASALQNLAALRGTMGTGAWEDRHEEAVSSDRDAAALGNVMGEANHAWELTLRAVRRGPVDGAEPLRQALALYARLPMEQLTRSERLNVEHLRTVADALVLEFSGDHDAAVRLWRDRLKIPEVQLRPDLLARTWHNLGDRLVRSAATAEEGLAALKTALAGRSLQTAPREHWETNLSMVIGLMPMLTGEHPWSVNISQREGYRRAVGAARAAVDAGRRLGLGEELARAGQYLCQLALLSEHDDEFEKLMEKGWHAVSDALPCMIDDEAAAHAEARLAESAALRVYGMRAQRAVVGMLREQTEVLHGEAAAAVRVWIDRAMLPQQRRLAARFAKPAWCDDTRWREWGQKLKDRNPLAIAQWVEATRAEHPDFLAPDADHDRGARWLAGAPGRGMIALLPTARGVLALLETARGVYATRLPAPELPVPAEKLPALLSELLSSTEAVQQLERVCARVRTALIDPLRALAGAPLTHVRLSLGDALRWLPPSALVPDAALYVAPSPSFLRRTAAEARAVQRVALLAADAKEDLEDGVDKIASLSQQLGSAVSVSTALGRGARWGRALGVRAEGLLERPPSPETLLDLAADSDVVVLLAHGRVIEQQGPAIELMRGDGQVSRLDAGAIAARPEAFAGCHVVLLACEAGFVEATPHRLGLLLGEILACGPASVTAALWAVPLPQALTVCRYVVHALCAGRAPEEGLKEAVDRMLRGDGGEEGPLLGRRITEADLTARRTAAARAWVTWRP